ncbi:MAG: glucosaminidase domain-containing protein [Sarcina sp.]
MNRDEYRKSVFILGILVLMILINIEVSMTPYKLSGKIEEDISIVSYTLIDKEDAKLWANYRGATNEFIELADLYWKYSQEHGQVNPALAYVQAAKETAFGRFGGVLDASYHNPCGLKTKKGGSDKEPSAHKKFKSWDDGVKAHLDHLALYAGAEEYPRKKTLDPRHFESIYGKAISAVSLSKNWAPSNTYGEEIMALYNQLMEYSGKLEEPVFLFMY